MGALYPSAILSGVLQLDVAGCWFWGGGFAAIGDGKPMGCPIDRDVLGGGREDM